MFFLLNAISCSILLKFLIMILKAYVTDIDCTQKSVIVMLWVNHDQTLITLGVDSGKGLLTNSLLKNMHTHTHKTNYKEYRYPSSMDTLQWVDDHRRRNHS